MPKVRIAIAGVGNCASLYCRGIEMYKNSRKTSSDLCIMNSVVINRVILM